MKVNVVDSFEKRIKSRFSHRQVLLYEQQIEHFKTQLQQIFVDLNKHKVYLN